MVVGTLSSDDTSIVQMQVDGNLHTSGTKPRWNKHHRHSNKSLVGGVAHSNLDELHTQSEDYLAALTTMIADGKALPPSIATFVEKLQNHSREIQAKLVDESQTQGNDLDARFNAVGACESSMTSENVDGNGASSAKNLASTGLSSLCVCREKEAKAKADLQGCNQLLTCYTDAKNSEDTALETFLTQSNQNPTLCSATWNASNGATDSDKALDFFSTRAAKWKQYYATQLSTLQGHTSAITTAQRTYDGLKDGTAPAFQGKGCAFLGDNSTDASSACSVLQQRATMNQCYYRSLKQALCDSYTQCRDSAETSWDTSKQRETRDSQNRQDAWLAAAQIKCMSDLFTVETNGSVNIGDGAHCDTKASSPQSLHF